MRSLGPGYGILQLQRLVAASLRECTARESAPVHVVHRVIEPHLWQVGHGIGRGARGRGKGKVDLLRREADLIEKSGAESVRPHHAEQTSRTALHGVGVRQRRWVRIQVGS